MEKTWKVSPDDAIFITPESIGSPASQVQEPIVFFSAWDWKRNRWCWVPVVVSRRPMI